LSDASHIPGVTFREWQLDRDSDPTFADFYFVRLVPQVKWDYFTHSLRPLADDCAAAVHEVLFAGVDRPFHRNARGWMGKIFRTVLSSPEWCDRGLTAEQALMEAFEGVGTGPAYAVYDARSPAVYAAEWPVMLDCWRRGWLMASDTFVLCAEGTRNAAMYWEGTGPYIASRGHQSLTSRCTGRP